MDLCSKIGDYDDVCVGAVIGKYGRLHVPLVLYTASLMCVCE